MKTEKKYTSKKRLKLALTLLGTGVIATVLAIISPFGSKPVSATIFLTSGTSWTVPTTWNNAVNTIEVIGGGGGGSGGATGNSGSSAQGGAGGGGGAYTKITNATLTPGASVTIAVGSGGAASSAGGDTYICNSTSNCGSISGSAVIAGAKGGGGASGTTAGSGGASASGVPASGGGVTKYSGGGGGSPGGSNGNGGSGGGGGGGAAGPAANGNVGADSSSGSGNSGGAGGAGGQGNGTNGGAGGSAGAANNGNGGNGGAGTEFDATHGTGGGSGGGGGGDRNGAGGGDGGTAGLYGAGGGAGGGGGRGTGGSASGGNGAAGRQGMIIIKYTYVNQENYRWRNESGTALAAENTVASINILTTARVRFTVMSPGSEATTYSYRLEYTTYNGSCGSTWTTVPDTPSSEHFDMVTTAAYTDQSATSNDSFLSDPSGYTFTAGKNVESTSNTASSVAIGDTQFTELEFALQANTNANENSYCFRVTNSGTDLNAYTNYARLTMIYPPEAPVILSPLNGSTSVSRLPTLQFRSKDNNSDYLRYSVEICLLNSWPCSSGALTFTQTAGDQTCWGGQNAESGTAYSSSSSVNSSATASCTVPLANILNADTQYYFRARAIDPTPGSNTYSPYSTVTSFSTGVLEILIQGGTQIGCPESDPSCAGSADDIIIGN